MLNAGIRADYFKFIYENQLSALYDLRYATKTAWSPKLNIQYTINKNMQLFVKSGKGFHSNDTRVVIDEQAQHVLPAAYGIDFGGVLKPNKNLIINAALVVPSSGSGICICRRWRDRRAKRKIKKTRVGFWCKISAHTLDVYIFRS
jgi:hypothetical protein